MSTQLLRSSNKDDEVFEVKSKSNVGTLPPQVFYFDTIIDHLQEALVEKRVSHNKAYRFKILETIFDFFETKREQLLEAASSDFNGKAALFELQLDYSLTLAQIAAALQTQCTSDAPSDKRFDRVIKTSTAHGGEAQVSTARPVGAVLIVAQPKRPFDDLFAPLSSAVAAGNAVCVVLSPTMPNINKVILQELTPQLPKSALFFINPIDMADAKSGVADLLASSSDIFGVQLPGSSHVAAKIDTPGAAYISTSMITSASKTSVATLKEVATEVVEGAGMCLGRGVGAPKYLFVHEEVYATFRDALLLAIATSSAHLCPRDDGNQLQKLLSNEQSSAAQVRKPFPSEQSPGPVALIEVSVEAARATQKSAIISDQKAVALIKDLAALVLVGVSSTEHALSIIEELGSQKGHLFVYSNDSAEVQHLLRELAPATLSVNHVAPENLFSSYAPKSGRDADSTGLRWPLDLFQTSSTAYLPAVRSTSLGLAGIAPFSAASRSSLSSAPTDQRRTAVKRALAKHLAKTKRLANRSRPAVALPLLRVFFLQGLFLFWGSALTCTLAGLGVGAFKLSHWAWMRFLSV